MYSKKNNNNDDQPSPDISRRRSRPGFHIMSVILVILFTVSCLLVIKPYDAAAVQAADLSLAGTTEPSPAEADTTPAITPPEASPGDTTQASAAPADTASPGTEQDATAAETSPDGAKPFVYNSSIPLDSDIQQYLYDLCVQRDLDYKMCLAIIKYESNFKAKALGGGSNYGLFQINKCNHKKLSSALKTANTPYDPKTNINWGTYLLSCLYEKYSSSYTGEDVLKAVLSAYNRGEGGFAKYGFATSYIKGYNKALAAVNSWFE